MKRIFTIVLIIFFIIQTAQSQINNSQKYTSEQLTALQEIDKLNTQVVSLYKEKKYDEALSLAKNVLEMAVKSGVSENLNVLAAIGNLADIYLVKGKASEAIPILQKNLNVYESLTSDNHQQIERILGRLSIAYSQKQDFKNSEAVLLKLLALREKVYGAENKFTAETNLTLAGLYQTMKKYEEAERHFVKNIEINDKILTADEKEVRSDIEAYQCFSFHWSYQKNKRAGSIKSFEAFMKNRDESVNDVVKDSVVNGKAINLVKPTYPESARAIRASGFAIVKVTIDEQGNVISAKAFCGYLDFVKEVEDAAMKSKFSPTLLNGIPVKVTGNIVYNFTAQ